MLSVSTRCVSVWIIIIVLTDEEEIIQVLLLNLHKKLLYDHYNKTISFIKTGRGVI